MSAESYWESGPIVERHPVTMPNTKPTLEFYTPLEVAQGLRVSKMTVYRLIHNGELDAINVGRSFRIYASSVREFLLHADAANLR